MRVLITVEGETTRFEITDEEASILVETDYQQRLKAAKDKAAVQKKTPQQILNSLYGPENDSRRRLHGHWVRPNLCTDKEGNVLDDYDSFALVRNNNGTGNDYRNLANLSHRSAEAVYVDAASEERLMQTLRETLTPDQLDLVMEVIIKGRKLSDYAAEQQVSKSAITQRMNTVKKKLKKFLF